MFIVNTKVQLFIYTVLFILPTHTEKDVFYEVESQYKIFVFIYKTHINERRLLLRKIN